MSPCPKIDCTTGRKTTLTLTRVNIWLRREAIREAETRDDDFALGIFEALPEDGKRFTTADLDSLNLYLWNSL